MKKHIRQKISVITYMALFILCIVGLSGHAMPSPKDNQLLEKGIQKTLEAEGYYLNYHLTMAYETLAFQIDGETWIDNVHQQQSGQFNLYTKEMNLGLLEGQYYLGDDYLAITLPKLIKSPYYLPIESLEPMDKHEVVQPEIFLKDATYNGKEAVAYTNEHNKTYNIWLYHYQCVWDLSELLAMAEQMGLGASLEEILPIEALSLNKAIVDVYIDEKDFIQKVEIYLVDKETGTKYFEGIFSLQLSPLETLKINKIEKDL